MAVGVRFGSREIMASFLVHLTNVTKVALVIRKLVQVGRRCRQLSPPSPHELFAVRGSIVSAEMNGNYTVTLRHRSRDQVAATFLAAWRKRTRLLEWV